MFENLTMFESILENPIVLALIVAVLRNVLGYVENVFRNRKESYDPAKLGETVMKYETLLILLSQWLPLGTSVGASLIIDIFQTALKKLKG